MRLSGSPLLQFSLLPSLLSYTLSCSTNSWNDTEDSDMEMSRKGKFRTAIQYSFAIFSMILAASCLGQAQDISGDWQGTLTTPMGEFRMVLHITRSADGTYKATMDSPDQAAPGANLDVITLDNSKVHFTLNILKAVFDGTLKSNGSING